MEYIEHTASTHQFCVNSSTMCVMDGEINIVCDIMKKSFVVRQSVSFFVIELLVHEVSFNLKILMYIETLVVTDLPL